MQHAALRQHRWHRFPSWAKEQNRENGGRRAVHHPCVGCGLHVVCCVAVLLGLLARRSPAYIEALPRSTPGAVGDRLTRL